MKTMYTVLRNDGYYPDGSYNGAIFKQGCVCVNLKDAQMWLNRKAAEKYVGKFGGKVIEVKVTYERVS